MFHRFLNASLKSIRYSNDNFGRNQLIVPFTSATTPNLDLDLAQFRFKKTDLFGVKNEVLTTADKWLLLLTI